MISKDEKAKIVQEFGGSATNTGSPETQIAILTARIKNLTDHFSDHKLDHHSKRGLMKLIGKRRGLLKYLGGKDQEKYKSLIGKLGLRK